jgi:predicted PurR-regulated permease PerM
MLDSERFYDGPSFRPQLERAQSQSLEVLASLIVLTLIVAALYVARALFVPIAIAILVSLVLSSPIRLLRRWGLGRVASVLIIVLAAFAITTLLSAALARQFSQLAVDLPLYEGTIIAKVDDLREAATQNPLFSRVSKAVKALGEFDLRPPTPSEMDHKNDNTSEGKQPVLAELYQPGPGLIAVVQAIANTAVPPLETASVIVIFVIFILLQREDLRNRLIGLLGSNDIQRTTLVMNEVAERLSRFFMVQTLVNLSFGVIVGVGLAFIGIPNPMLWGFVAFLLRYVAYLGPLIATSAATALAAACEPGWTLMLETAALFLFAEAIIAQVLEPLLYGQKTGISPSAVVTSATFWTWLWGVPGLVLSTPLAVCLAVLGRHVQRLSFLDVIFGDTPPLSEAEIFYQRALAGDAAEVANQAERFLKHQSLFDYFEGVALQALLLAQADRQRGVMDELQQRRIKETIEEALEDLSDHVEFAPKETEQDNDETTRVPAAMEYESETDTNTKAAQNGHAPALAAGSHGLVLCIAGRSLLDEAAAALFARILAKNGIASKVEPAAVLTIGQISHLQTAPAEIVCLSYLESASASARFAVRRLRRHLPKGKILCGLWQSSPARLRELCDETKANFCAGAFKDALNYCLEQSRKRDERDG